MTADKGQADFATIRTRVTMQMVIEHYHIEGLKKAGNELRGKCPFHPQGVAERSFSVNTSKQVFQCFYCKAKGNVIDFVAKKENCNLREAGLKLWEWFKLDEQTSSPQPAQELPELPSKELLQGRAVAHPTHKRKAVKFNCPYECGGEITKKMSFYLTSQPAFAIHGKCNQCGGYAEAEIPLEQLFKDAPTVTIQ